MTKVEGEHESLDTRSAADRRRDEARGYTDEDLADVLDNPEGTDEQLANAKPFAEVFPDLAAGIERNRGAQRGR